MSSWEDRDCSTARINQEADRKKPNKNQGNTAAGAGEEPLRRMRQEQLSDQAAAASGSTGLKGAMTAASKICHHK